MPRCREDTLSAYPISIESETTDTSTLISSFMDAGSDDGDHPLDAVYSNTIMYDLFNNLNSAATTTNNMKPFKEFLDSDRRIAQHASAIQYTYDLQLPIYTQDEKGKIIETDFAKSCPKRWAPAADSVLNSNTPCFPPWSCGERCSPARADAVNPLLEEQYDLIYGSWPKNYDEVVLIVNKRNEISDLVLYSLGFKDSEQLPEIIQAAMNGEQIEEVGDESWSYEGGLREKFKIILPVGAINTKESTNSYVDMSATETGLEFLYNEDSIGVELKIVGVIRPNEDATAAMLTAPSATPARCPNTSSSRRMKATFCSPSLPMKPPTSSPACPSNR